MKKLNLQKVIKQFEICNQNPLMDWENELLDEELTKSSALFTLEGCGAKILYLYHGAYEETKDNIIQKLDENNHAEVKDALNRLENLNTLRQTCVSSKLYAIIYTTRKEEKTIF